MLRRNGLHPRTPTLQTNGHGLPAQRRSYVYRNRTQQISPSAVMITVIFTSLTFIGLLMVSSGAMNDNVHRETTEKKTKITEPALVDRTSTDPIPPINTLYDELDRETLFDAYNLSTMIYHSNGGTRTGSTMMFNILRVLIREKIDPNMHCGWAVDTDPALKDSNYVLLVKQHGFCGETGKIFISHRNVSHVVRSMMDFNQSLDGEHIAEWCGGQGMRYESCRNHEGLQHGVLYDMSYEALIGDMHAVIVEMANALRISHVMSPYDYKKIEFELEHLVAPSHGIHPVTALHSHHRATSNDGRSSRDLDFIVNHIIRTNEACNRYYELVNDVLIQERAINQKQTATR